MFNLTIVQKMENMLNTIDLDNRCQILPYVRGLLCATLQISQRVKLAYERGSINKILPKDVICTTCELYKRLLLYYPKTNIEINSDKAIDIIVNIATIDVELYKYLYTLLQIVHIGHETSLYEINSELYHFNETALGMLNSQVFVGS